MSYSVRGRRSFFYCCTALHAVAVADVVVSSKSPRNDDLLLVPKALSFFAPRGAARGAGELESQLFFGFLIAARCAPVRTVRLTRSGILLRSPCAVARGIFARGGRCSRT